MSAEAESFQSQVLRLRGRTGLTQRELAQRLGAHVRSIQLWESASSFPSATSLQGLIAAFLEAGAFQSGHPAAEAEALWVAAQDEAPRLRTPFDAAWFAGLLAGHGAPAALEHGPAVAARQDWGEAPDSVGFLGRATELGILREWATEQRCRLIGLVGLGGIGKTALAAQLARELASSFGQIYWRSVRNAPSLSDWLGDAIGFLSGQPLVPVQPETARLSTLLRLLREHRCLLIIDNFETLMQPGVHEGEYRASFSGYGRLLEVVADTPHQSCVLVTSRETPAEMGPRAATHSAVRVMQLGGLGFTEGQALLREQGVSSRSDDAAWESLLARYGGNGLALKMVGETIRQVFDGDIAAFLDQVGFRTVFGSIRRLIESHVERLSPVEREALQILTLAREPVTFAELVANVGPAFAPDALLEAIEALRRRSLIERSETGSAFTPHSVVLEYMTAALVELVSREITRGELDMLKRHPVIRAEAKDYIRRAQERMLLVPLLDNITVESGGKPAAEARLLALLAEFRQLPLDQHGYAPGNLVNLLRVLRGDLRGVNMSRLALRQTFLQEVEAQDASLAGAHLEECVLAAAYRYPACMALSTDGSRLAVGTPTGDVCVWRVADRKLVGVLRGHSGAVRGVALSEDGRTLATAGEDGMVRVWDTEESRVVLTLRDADAPIWSVALCDDRGRVACGCDHGWVYLWDARDGRLLSHVQAHIGQVRGVALSHDGRTLASAGADGCIRVWEPERGWRPVQTLGHGGEVWALALSADGPSVMAGGLDGTVQIWDVGTGESIARVPGHAGGVSAVALSRDGSVAISGGNDGTVRVWEVAQGRQLASLRGHSAAVCGVALNGAGHLAASANEDGTIRLWEAQSGLLLATLQGHRGGVTSVALNAAGGVVARASVDGTVMWWDVATGELLGNRTGHTAGVRAVALATDVVVTGNADGTIKIWEFSTGRLLATLSAHIDGVWGVALSADGQLLASASFDGTVKLWSAPDWQLYKSLAAGEIGGVRGVALSRDGRRVAAVGMDGSPWVWDTCDGNLLTLLTRPAGGLRGISLDDQGQLLLTAGADGELRVTEIERSTAQLRASWRTGTGVQAVAMSGDGRLVATASADGRLQVWDAATGNLQHVLSVDDVAIWSMVLTADGRRLASGSPDGSVRVWDTSSGTLIRTFRADRHYEGMDITALTGVTDIEREALLALGAVEKA